MEKTLADQIDAARVAYTKIVKADATVEFNRRLLRSAQAKVNSLHDTLEASRDHVDATTENFWEIHDDVLSQIFNLKVSEKEKTILRKHAAETMFPKR